jgi:hypothetical protein
MSCIDTCLSTYDTNATAVRNVAQAAISAATTTAEIQAIMAQYRLDMATLIDNLEECIIDCFTNQEPPGDPPNG